MFWIFHLFSSISRFQEPTKWALYHGMPLMEKENSCRTISQYWLLTNCHQGRLDWNPYTQQGGLCPKMDRNYYVSRLCTNKICVSWFWYGRYGYLLFFIFCVSLHQNMPLKRCDQKQIQCLCVTTRVGRCDQSGIYTLSKKKRDQKTLRCSLNKSWFIR